MLVSPLVTILFLKCSAIFRSVIILKKRPSILLGNFSPKIWVFRKRNSTSPFLKPTMKPLIFGTSKKAFLASAFFVLAKKITFGKWATPVLAALAPKFFMITVLKQVENLIRTK